MNKKISKEGENQRKNNKEKTKKCRIYQTESKWRLRYTTSVNIRILGEAGEGIIEFWPTINNGIISVIRGLTQRGKNVSVFD